MRSRQAQARAPPQLTASMSGHQGGDTSKLSLEMSLINKQLWTGKTRKGLDLEGILGKREKLEERKAAIVAKMEQAKQARHDERMNAINAHTASVGEGVKSCIKQELAPIKEDVAAITQIMTANNSAIEKIREYHEKAPPSNPGDLELMEKVLNKFKVGRMNNILKQFNVDRPAGVKREGKAALIVKNIARSQLVELLEAPEDLPASSASRQPATGLHAFFRSRASAAADVDASAAVMDESEAVQTANMAPRKSVPEAQTLLSVTKPMKPEAPAVAAAKPPQTKRMRVRASYDNASGGCPKAAQEKGLAAADYLLGYIDRAYQDRDIDGCCLLLVGLRAYQDRT
jgi:hypothetical protein